MLFSFHHLHNFIYYFLTFAFANGIRNTRFHVIFQNNLVDLPERRLHGQRLMDDVDAVRAGIHHVDNFIQVSARNFETMED